jgi:uncharacterized membrane protein YbhN (UPF0104 family)
VQPISHKNSIPGSVETAEQRPVEPQQPAVDHAGEDGSSAEGDAHRLRNGVIWTVALGVMFLAIGFAVPDLRGVLDRVAHAHAGWLVLAVGLEVASCLGYVAVVRLVIRDARPRDVRRLAWAEQAFGAVVPVGGAGGLAVGAWAMRAWGFSWPRIVNRSAVIFLLTSAVNGAVMVLAGLGVWAGIGTHRAGPLYGLVPAAATTLALGAFCVTPVLARRVGPEPGPIGSLVVRIASWVRNTASVAIERNWRVLGSITYLLFDIAVLWACLRAVGASVPLLALVVGYQVGYLANLVPIPGAIGVLEGGLLGALVLYGLPAEPAAAAVVMYHAIALWVPTLAGTFSFVRLRKTVPARARELPAVAAEKAEEQPGEAGARDNVARLPSGPRELAA